MSRKSSRAFETALSIMNAEIVAERINENIRSQPQRTEKEEPKFRTDIYRKTNYTVQDRYTIVHLQGSGKLVKLRISSPTSAFTVLLRIDGETLIDDSYTNLTETLAAYQEDSIYYLHLEDKLFKESLLVDVEVPSPTVFNLLYAEVLVQT